MIDNNSENFDIKIKKNAPNIIVLGVGGAGGNALLTIKKNDIKNISCIALNTDIQAIESLNEIEKIQIGTQITRGMGTGSNPEIGKIAAEEDIEFISEATKDADIVFLIGGLGGGTASGAIPVIARLLQERQILTVAIVTKPFQFEGAKRMNVAQMSLQKIEEYVDTLIVIPNQKLFEKENSDEIKLKDAFEDINSVIANSIRAVSDTINNTGNINIDFADIKSIMTKMGRAIIAIGKGLGENRAQKAIENALISPLLENTNLKGAHSILINIHGNNSISLKEVNLIAGFIHEQAHIDAHIIVGSTIDESLADEIMLTIIATGFEDQIKNKTSRYTQQNSHFFQNNKPILNKPSNNFVNFRNKNDLQQNKNLSNANNQQSFSYKENIQNFDNTKNIEEKTINDLEVPAFLRKNNIQKTTAE